MEKYSDNRDEIDDIAFNFKDDGRTFDEREKFINELIEEKNKYLVSMGYVMDSDGDLVKPDNRIVDGILGFAVGDALGVPYEFFSRERISRRPCKDMIGFGSHHMSEGTWSDDTSMVVATMDSIMENGMIDLDDIMFRFDSWFRKSMYTANDKVFDIGRTVKKAILKFEDGIEPVLCGGRGNLDNGNGSLMRMLPIVYFLNCNNYDVLDEVELINNVSSLTHGHEISCLGCKIYVDYVKQLLNGVDKFDALNNVKQIKYSEYYSNDSVNEYDRILNADIFKLSIDDIESSAYVVSSLEASLWSVLNTDSYDNAVLKAINLGGDADTIGAITGSMAGIIYGKKNIPSSWLNKLRRREYLEDMCYKFGQSLNSLNNIRKK